jgi:hypothetical protein
MSSAARLADLARRRLQGDEYLLAREVLAFAFQADRRKAPSPAELARWIGGTMVEAKRRFDEGRKDEAQRALAREFPLRESEWSAGVSQLRDIKGLEDPRDFEIACQLVACVLGHLEVNDTRMAGAIGIPRQTFQDQRVRIWRIVKEVFPALAEPLGRGRRR